MSLNDEIETDLYRYRYLAIQAAKDFRYGIDVVKQLKETKSGKEIEQIMRFARNRQN